MTAKVQNQRIPASYTKLMNPDVITPGKSIDLMTMEGKDFVLTNRTLLTSALFYSKGPLPEGKEVTAVVGIYETDSKNFIELFSVNLLELAERKFGYVRPGGGIVLSKKAYIAVTSKGGDVPKEYLRLKVQVANFS